jgi:transposase
MNDLKTNAKNLSQKEQYQIRKNIARLLKKGNKPNDVAEMLDVSRSLVYDVKKKYAERGLTAIQAGIRGRKFGSKRILSAEQEAEMITILINKTPMQLDMNHALWSKSAIHEYVLKKHKIDLPPSTLGIYLKRWGFSLQRPAKRASKQNPELVKAWLEEEYPIIQAKAKFDNAEIYWGDETALQNTANYIKGYAPIGKTPILTVESKKLKLNMLSAVSNRGLLRFTITKESVNADILIDFMRRLIGDSGRKVLLILDNLRVHHSIKVRVWVEKHKDEIELFYLPPYSPEYNPDEYLNSDLKRAMEKKAMPNSEKGLRTNTRSFLKKRQLEPEKVKAYFKTKYTKYAA